MFQRRVIRTMCPMSCHPTLCGMLVEVDNGRLVGIITAVQVLPLDTLAGDRA